MASNPFLIMFNNVVVQKSHIYLRRLLLVLNLTQTLLPNRLPIISSSHHKPLVKGYIKIEIKTNAWTLNIMNCPSEKQSWHRRNLISVDLKRQQLEAIRVIAKYAYLYFMPCKYTSWAWPCWNLYANVFITFITKSYLVLVLKKSQVC